MWKYESEQWYKKSTGTYFRYVPYYYKGKTLYEVYGRCSSTKKKAWEDISRQCRELDGENLHITGAGSHFFSCMYAYPIIDAETGEITDMVLRKETAGNTYDLTLPIEEYNSYARQLR